MRRWPSSLASGCWPAHHRAAHPGWDWRSGDQGAGVPPCRV